MALATGDRALPWIKVSEDKAHFVAGDSREPFVVWGVNYDHDDGGRLIEDYWESDWQAVVGDFQ
ncbi:MAG: cellulase family glycosylhydrolase, partial [Aureliella sp.]